MGATHGEHGAELTEATLYPTLHAMEARRILRAEWSEEGQTRLHYRVASKGAILAEKGGWPAFGKPLAERGANGAAAGEAGAPNTIASLPRTQDEYLDRLEAAINLSKDRCNGIRHEIRDHLNDAAAECRRQGQEDAQAMTSAMAGLGSPELLGKQITHAELTGGRLRSGLRTATVSALFGATLGVAMSGIVVLSIPILGRLLVNTLQGSGIHLYLPSTTYWYTEQVALILLAAAFFAARRSTPVASESTRRSMHSIKPIWGIGGAVVLAILALLLPSQFDPLSAIVFLLVPVAWLLGTWRCQRPGDDLTSKFGVAQALVLFIVLLFIPGIRVWTFNPDMPVRDPLPAAASNARVSVSVASDSITVTGGESGWSDFKVDAWPALRQGLEIVPDPSAQQSTFSITPGSAFQASSLPDAPHDWWMVLSAVGADGVRHRLDVAVLPGHSSVAPNNILGWLIGR